MFALLVMSLPVYHVISGVNELCSNLQVRKSTSTVLPHSTLPQLSQYP